MCVIDVYRFLYKLQTSFHEEKMHKLNTSFIFERK
jgi:hypothetical protein